jgi:hypothetical protein
MAHFSALDTVEAAINSNDPLLEDASVTFDGQINDRVIGGYETLPQSDFQVSEIDSLWKRR